MRIESAQNRKIRSTRKLRKGAVRDREMKFLVEGATGVVESLSSHSSVEEIFLQVPAAPSLEEIGNLAIEKGAAVHEVSDQAMKALSSAATPPGIIAVATFTDTEVGSLLGRPMSLAVILAGLRDPGNAGTILRTAWAVGADAVFFGNESVDVYNPKVVRAAAGALFHQPFARGVEVAFLLEELGKKGLMTVAADPQAGVAYEEINMTKPCAFVFGNEAWGVAEDLLGKTDILASISMESGAESLNVAIAAAVFLFEARRQRRGNVE